MSVCELDGSVPFVGAWPPRQVRDLFPEAASEARAWAAPFGDDFAAAWWACPREHWLLHVVRTLLSRLGPEARAELARQLEGPRTGPVSPIPWLRVPRRRDVEALRRDVDGPALFRAVGLVR